MKKAILIGIIFLLIPLVFADDGHIEHEGLEQAEAIINAEIPCSGLTEDQLELIGDYYMEQMHPGEQHELMDEMMGGEGSESLKQMHIAMAQRFYCNDYSSMAQYGMMGMMDNNYDQGMMGNNMMGYGNGYGMMGYGYFNLLPWLLLIVAIAIIIWLLAKDRKKGGKR